MFIKMKTLEKEIVLVDDNGFVDLFLELENRSVIPFLYVTIKSDSPQEFVKKSKVDGSINPYWKQIVKESSKTYRLVVNFKKRVENELGKEGKSVDEYQQGTLKGKKHISKCLLTDLETETEKYVMLEYFVNSPIKGVTKYFNEGNELDKSILSKWITYYEKSYDNQGTDKPITPITPFIKNIQQVNVDGIVYKRK
jgi:hypothetical protein